MLHRPLSRSIFAGIVGLGLATISIPATADVYFETSYLPTSSVYTLPTSVLATSYVVPTAYLPTSYYVPTSYLSTSSVISSDPVFYPTSTTILRRSLFRPRRYVERTYYSSPLISTSYLLPTSYVVPTTFVSTSSLLPTTYITRSDLSPTSYLIDNGVVTTSFSSSSSYPCETSTTSPVKSTVSRPLNNKSSDSGNTITSEPSNGSMSNERPPQATLNSSTTGEEAPSSAVNPTLPNSVPPPATVPTTKPETGTPPNPQGLDGPKPEDIKIPPAGESSTVPKTNETVQRIVRRPNYEVRNILRGRVISAESRRPEEGVTVIISNVTKAYSDRPAMTDADGEFKVSLPDGDWIVKVKMPSGSVSQVGREYVTASSGRVTDSSGRNVAEFVITR